MTNRTPLLLRIARTLTFTGVCGLVCGALISRPALSSISVGLALLGMSGEAFWNLWTLNEASRGPTRDIARMD